MRSRLLTVAILFSSLALLVLTFGAVPPLHSAGLLTSRNGPRLSPVTPLAAGPVPTYEKFEVAFQVEETVAINPFFPYDPTTPPGVESEQGISVDMQLRRPSASGWDAAQPCFYYQPVDAALLLPVGRAGWRCRISPDEPGLWRYRLRAADAAGTTFTQAQQIDVVPSGNRGFLRVGDRDARFFEFADGAPFYYPLVNAEFGNPFNSLRRIRAAIPRLGQNGVRFVRWFPTEYGANYFVVPFAGDIVVSWGFGAEHGAGVIPDASDTATDHRFSFVPYRYSYQRLQLPPGDYRLIARARVANDKRLPVAVQGATAPTRMLLAGDDWHTASLTFAVAFTRTVTIRLVGDGTPDVRVNRLSLQRDETGAGGWGPNLLYRSDPDTYRYVDQIGAARLDEILALSEQHGVYHKLPILHRHDAVLNRFRPDGTVGAPHASGGHFYAAPNTATRWYQDAYTRYFVARWGYSPALHSLEQVNEAYHPNQVPGPYASGRAFAATVHDPLYPRHILASNSFWGLWGEWDAAQNFLNFWSDPQLDYADKHWYAQGTGECIGDCDPAYHKYEFRSNLWYDSAAYARACSARFDWYAGHYGYDRPLVQGEGGVAGGLPHDCLTGRRACSGDRHRVVYTHKKLWANLGNLGYSCDGEWFVGPTHPATPDAVFASYRAYERFLDGEPLNNGHYQKIGTDLSGAGHISLTGASGGDLRAWGVWDPGAGEMLLWIDNATHTWWNVASAIPPAPASATLSLPWHVRGGAYTLEWWDTTTGEPTATERGAVGGDGRLTLSVADLAGDVAVKIRAVGGGTRER